MNTPAHLIFGAAAFGRPGRPGVTWAAVTGGFLPDASLYLMFAWSRIIMEVPARTIFREYYYSPEWQRVFAIDNSFVVWGAVLALALGLGHAALTAFAGAGLLHLTFDFPLHNEDARQHFWPLSDWVFVSPVSYWDGRHYGDLVEPVELAAALVLVALMLVRFKGLAARAAIAALGATEMMASGVWRFVF